MLFFSKKAHLKLKYFVQHANTEISGLGQSRIMTPSIIHVDDIKIFPQTCTPVHTQLDEDKLAKFLHKKTVNKEDVSHYNIWWHSHADFGTFWSGMDEQTIETTTSNSYLISLVVNKKMEMLARLDIFKPFRLTIPLKIYSPTKVRNNKKIEEYCLRRIKKCVKKPKLVIKDKKISLIPLDFKNQSILLEQVILDLKQQCPWLEWDFHI